MLMCISKRTVLQLLTSKIFVNCSNISSYDMRLTSLNNSMIYNNACSKSFTISEGT